MFIFGLNNCNTFRERPFNLKGGYVYDQESGIIIFSTETNVTCLCNDVEELFIDGTFKCCAHHFYQLHTIHGGKKGNYVTLVEVLEDVFGVLYTKKGRHFPNLFCVNCSHSCLSARFLSLQPDA
jgi:hypothetical protein